MMDQAVAAELEFHLELERRINASAEEVFDALLVQLGPEAVTPELPGVPS